MALRIYNEKGELVTTDSTIITLLTDMLVQLKQSAGDQADVEERIQQQLATMNEEDNIEPGNRRY